MTGNEEVGHETGFIIDQAQDSEIGIGDRQTTVTTRHNECQDELSELCDLFRACFQGSEEEEEIRRKITFPILGPGEHKRE